MPSSYPSNILPEISKIHSTYPILSRPTNPEMILKNTYNHPVISSHHPTKNKPPLTTISTGTPSEKCTKRVNLAPSATVTPGIQMNPFVSSFAPTPPPFQPPCYTDSRPTRARPVTSPSTAFSVTNRSTPLIWPNSIKSKA